jgi:ComF family protein
MVNRWLESAHALLFPPNCVLCGASGQPPLLDLCTDCENDLPGNEHACARCALPLNSAAAQCNACLVRPPPFDRALVPFRYSYPLRNLVRSLKYVGELSHARILGTLVARAAGERRDALPHLIVPVPLHRLRYRERGFNQARELARFIGSALRIPIDDRTCTRVRATADQTELSAAERRKNVRGAFAMTGPLRARHVAIVDDVLTTGSTVAAIAPVIRAAGATTIEVWAVARAIPGPSRQSRG